jgi:Flp pilus assembly protein CpaB
VVVTRQRLLIAGGVAVAAVAVAVLVTQLTGRHHVAVPAEPVEGTTQMSRSGTLFGDRVRASDR